MPELPEVETIVRDLRNQNLTGKKITQSSITWARTLATPGIQDFQKHVLNKCIVKISRRAKYIIFSLNSGFSILIHLRMTGKLNFFDPKQKKTKHDHVALSFEDGRELRYTDTRKFGRWYLLKDTNEKFKSLGPEPLSKNFKAEEFYENLHRHKRQLKPLLLDQSFLSGLGNIYVDEALFDARLHPTRLSHSLKAKECSQLYVSIRKVLQNGIDNLGTSLGKADTNYYSVGGRRGRNQDTLKVFRKTGQPCPRCDKKIARLIVGQRSSHICTKCQK